MITIAGGIVTMSEQDYFDLRLPQIQQLPTKAAIEQTKASINVTEILTNLGILKHLKGFEFLREAINLSVGDVSYVHEITTKLYPAVARKYNTTPSRVERAMRHSIEVAWSRCDYELHDLMFGHSIKTSTGKPTNSAFIAIVSDKIRMN